jgi:uncharacterized protein (UPF0335 family)
MSEIAEIGHNSEPAMRFAADVLKSIVERIERLEADKADIASDIKDVYAESKGNGFDVKALRTIIRLRKQSPDDVAAQEAVLETHTRRRWGCPDEPMVARI